MSTYGPSYRGPKPPRERPVAPGFSGLTAVPYAFRVRHNGSGLGERQCCRLFRLWPQVSGLSSSAAQKCTDGLKTGVGFLVSGINPDGFLVALDG